MIPERPTHQPIIILNGASSSGKSSIAAALQAVLPHPALHLDHDTFAAMLPPDHFQREDRTVFRARVLELMRAVNRASKALYDGGYGIIVDCLLGRWDVLLDMMEVFGDDALFVGVMCPLEELERREQRRGDRSVGMARRQNEWVHTAGIYDVEVDTNQLRPAECAAVIVKCWEARQGPSAFARLKTKYAAGAIGYNFFRDAP